MRDGLNTIIVLIHILASAIQIRIQFRFDSFRLSLGFRIIEFSTTVHAVIGLPLQLLLMNLLQLLRDREHIIRLFKETVDLTLELVQNRILLNVMLFDAAEFKFTVAELVHNSIHCCRVEVTELRNLIITEFDNY
jgi:hypothetical protein